LTLLQLRWVHAWGSDSVPVPWVVHPLRWRNEITDRGLPACQQCITSRHSCDGYITLRVNNLGIIHSGDHGASSMTAIPSHGICTSESSTSTVGQRTAPFCQPAELPLVAFRNQMAGSYFFATYVWAPFWRSLLLSATSLVPDPRFPNMQLHSVVNQSCFDALVCSYMGFGHGDATLRNTGGQLYSRALA